MNFELKELKWFSFWFWWHSFIENSSLLFQFYCEIFAFTFTLLFLKYLIFGIVLHFEVFSYCHNFISLRWPKTWPIHYVIFCTLKHYRPPKNISFFFFFDIENVFIFSFFSTLRFVAMVVKKCRILNW